MLKHGTFDSRSPLTPKGRNSRTLKSGGVNGAKGQVGYKRSGAFGALSFRVAVFKEKRFRNMLTGYFDEGVRKNLFTAVCGWTSTVEQWDGFEVDWKLFLASYRVPYFHMKEFAPSQGPFAKWKDRNQIRKRFCHDAAEIIKSRVKLGFIFYVRDAAFNTVNSLFDVSGVWSSPYGMAGRCCMELAEDWRKEHRNSEEIKYVFDGGCPDKGGLIRAVTNIKPFLPIPSFEASRDWKKSAKWPNGRKALVQLQAADYLAYECRKAMADRLEKHIPAKRKSFAAILGVPVRMAAIQEMRLARICNAYGITRRLPPNSEIYDRFKL
ncbi:MAG: hypothetical protein ACRD4S_00105 [Candidatus Acidiferrales bacterium]